MLISLLTAISSTSVTLQLLVLLSSFFSEIRTWHAKHNLPFDFLPLVYMILTDRNNQAMHTCNLLV